MGLLQKQDFKSEADLVALGSSKSAGLLSDDYIYVASNGIAETLDDAITNNKLYKTTSAPVGLSDTQSISNKTLDDSTTSFANTASSTKKARIECGSVTAGQTRVITVPDTDLTLVGTSIAQVITAKDIDGGTASNTSRVTLPKNTLANLTGLTRKQGTIAYDTTNNKVVYDDGSVLTAVGSGGAGGGGSSLIWRNDDTFAAEEATSYGQLSYVFNNNYDQNIYTIVKVPNTYTAGKQITIKGKIYCPTAGAATILLSMQSTLIRSGTDALSSTTNQRTTTGTAVAINTANLEYVVSWDITDSSAQINGVSISANDTIIVRLYRTTDTNTDNAYFMPGTSELIIAP
jgi:hypothetical protein